MHSFLRKGFISAENRQDIDIKFGIRIAHMYTNIIVKGFSDRFIIGHSPNTTFRPENHLNTRQIWADPRDDSVSDEFILVGCQFTQVFLNKFDRLLFLIGISGSNCVLRFGALFKKLTLLLMIVRRGTIVEDIMFPAASFSRNDVEYLFTAC
ncbi:hypothetical protein FF38_00733 [Lucilia cuprina]|uniref:Uncharacterized protein n=1 Tax=Lucilia cuprina TaxID=7375 RepID=A0A0L0CPY9_LUCCU|nr:hypothetical protein FF38_00733 [Lucilia cuprina]